MKKRTYDHTRTFGDIGIRNAAKNSAIIVSDQERIAPPAGMSGIEIGRENPLEESSKKHFYLEYDLKPTRYDQIIDTTAVRNIVSRENNVDNWIQRGTIWDYIPPIGKELIITRINFFVLKSNWPVDPRADVGPNGVNMNFGHFAANPMEYFNIINFDVLINGVPPVTYFRRVTYETSAGVVTITDQKGPSALSFDLINDAEPRPGSYFLRVPQQERLEINFFNRHNGGANEFITYQSPRSAGMRLRGFLRDLTSDKRRDRDRGM